MLVLFFKRTLEFKSKSIYFSGTQSTKLNANCLVFAAKIWKMLRDAFGYPLGSTLSILETSGETPKEYLPKIFSAMPKRW